MFKLLVLLPFLFAVIYAGNFNSLKNIRHGIPSKPRIIGGEEVAPHSVPFQVGLRINGNAFCGGSLISPNFVVTAGHCGIVTKSVDVILGAHNISDTSEASQVIIRGSKVVVHEDYNTDNFRNDIALIQLEKAAPISDVIKAAKLPPKSDAGKTYVNEIATATGWGLPHDVPYPSTSDMSDVLLRVDVAVTDLADCGLYFNGDGDDYIVKSNICTSGHQDKGTCNGDSGGPLILNGVLIGLTSFGTEECEWCAPSVYTRIETYLDWIAKNSDVEI